MSLTAVVNIVGYGGSGKSAVSELLKARHGFEIYRPSDLIRLYAKSSGLSLKSRQDYIDCHIAMVEKDELAMIRPLENMFGSVCVDGLRAPKAMEFLRQKYSGFCVFLECPDEVRFDRVFGDSSRDTHRKPPTFEEFIADESPDRSNSDHNLPSLEDMKQSAEYVLDVSNVTAEQVCETIYSIAASRSN